MAALKNLIDEDWGSDVEIIEVPEPIPIEISSDEEGPSPNLDDQRKRKSSSEEAEDSEEDEDLLDESSIKVEAVSSDEDDRPNRCWYTSKGVKVESFWEFFSTQPPVDLKVKVKEEKPEKEPKDLLRVGIWRPPTYRERHSVEFNNGWWTHKYTTQAEWTDVNSPFLPDSKANNQVAQVEVAGPSPVAGEGAPLTSGGEDLPPQIFWAAVPDNEWPAYIMSLFTNQQGHSNGSWEEHMTIDGRNYYVQFEKHEFNVWLYQGY
ncbi:uncharacterized protein LOC108091058 [Drosophila ficusphila]|uniref:uncharacterized protein LOC108091058 n=1 Tax=Drosophila ficusphila TaxID=30025 RepID=UPI0007E68FFB|nr:uncharacterized protein LOC108091058 [Drosophila ficusphila]